MESTLYQSYVDKYFEGIVLAVNEELNGTQNPNQQRYWHREMLTPEYSVNGMWESATVHNTRVSADFVALDSALPVKKRNRISKVYGKIVKSGMELSLNETQIQDLNTMIRTRGVPQSDIIARLFEDTPRVIYGIYELMERAFLQALSTGVCLIEDKDNVGIGVRMDFGYLDENKFDATTDWSDYDDAKPLDDLKKMVKKAKKYGRSINYVLMDDTTLDHLLSCDQTREWLAYKNNYVFTSNDNLPPADLAALNSKLSGDPRFGFTIEEVDRKIIVERDAEQTTVTPWASGMVIGLPTRNVGILSWSTLAEADNPVNGVSYQNAGDGILVSKFSTNRPFKEYTTSQARIVPVISNVKSIYQLNALPSSDAIDIDDDDDDNGGGTGTGTGS